MDVKLMSNINIRKYRPDDEATLLHMTAGKFAEDLAEFSRDRINVAEYDGAVAGWSYTNIRSEKGMMSFVAVYVSEEFRCRSIGTALYREAEARCIEVGCEELFSSYYESSAVKFADKLEFSYSNSASRMEYNGGLLHEASCAIRKCCDDDYYLFDDIWSRRMFEMHKRIGLPITEPVTPNEEFRQQYRDDADNMFVLEDEGKIVAVGGLMGDSIGCLAVELDMNNRGYGTALAVFLTNVIIRRGNKTAYLTCETGNDNACHVYEKIGYKEIYKEYYSVKKLK